MYAIFRSGGHQYRASEGETIAIERVSAGEGDQVAFDEVLLVGGNLPGGVQTPECDRYDPRTGLWKPAAPMPAPRLHPSATLLPCGKVLVAGGAVDSNFVAGGPVFEGVPASSGVLYDPATDTWTRKAPLPEAPGFLAGSRVVLNGRPRIEMVSDHRNWQYVP